MTTDSVEGDLRNTLAILKLNTPQPAKAELAGVWDRIVSALEKLEGKSLGMANPYRD